MINAIARKILVTIRPVSSLQARTPVVYPPAPLYSGSVSNLTAILERAAGDGLVVALTGAGISAESGIPTFRGEEGYWTVDSKVYRPQEMATNTAYRRMPEDVWQWYLYRRAVCREAAPNLAHAALVELDQLLGERFRLITQNVDGLHLRAGSPMERTYQIHGNIDYMRCGNDCTNELWPLPSDLQVPEDHLAAKEYRLSEADLALLRCPECGARSRPHVLWFDESYDEPLFRFESSLEAAAHAVVVIIVGTSAATTLPNHVVNLAARAGAGIIDINIDTNPFAEIADQLPTGIALRGAAGEHVPSVVKQLSEIVAG